MTTADDALVSRLQEIIDSDSRAVLWGGRGPTGEAPGDAGGLRMILLGDCLDILPID